MTASASGGSLARCGWAAPSAAGSATRSRRATTGQDSDAREKRENTALPDARRRRVTQPRERAVAGSGGSIAAQLQRARHEN